MAFHNDLERSGHDTKIERTLRMSVDEAPWRITCPPDVFASLRRDEGFWQLLALARLANALRFAQVAIPAPADDTPSGIRQRVNSFSSTVALLKEGVPLLQRMGNHFRHLDSYGSHVLPILRDRAVESILSENVKPLRDEAVAHFLELELGPRLDDHDFQQHDFAIGLGNSQGQTYYLLADELAFRAFTGTTATRDEFLERMGELLRRSTVLIVRFVSATDLVIGEALREMGWTMEVG
jgi:hypothetical protein